MMAVRKRAASPAPPKPRKRAVRTSRPAARKRPPKSPLAADLRRIAFLLERHLAGAESETPGPLSERPEVEDSPVDRLARIFGLTPFERDIVLLCAAVELDRDCAALVARLQQGSPPTFALALAALPEAHWSALMPVGPLRYWRLVELGSGPSLVGSTLRIDERILHYLLDLQFLDERLAAIVEVGSAPDELVPSQRAIAERMAAVWQAGWEAAGAPPVLALAGDDPAAQRGIAASASALAGSALLVLHATDFPDGEAAFDQLQRLWERESLLVSASRLLVADRPEAPDRPGDRRLDRLVERAAGPLILSAEGRPRPGERTILTFDVLRPSTDEQLAIWHQTLGDARGVESETLRALVFQFDLDLASIRAAAADALAAAGRSRRRLGPALWESCRNQARARIEGGVQRIEPVAVWDDLVLPEREQKLVSALVDQIRHRPTVYGDWGFAEKATRGLGIAALFAGPSGTGKTLAAEVIAAELRLDLYRIDLSAVVNKYIGETEKNLKRVFDAAEAGGAVLLFDEADALFGKRSEVKDSHDRHANIEVSYLLQRVEAYRGLAILATNLKDYLDQAFLRRLRFIVQFPFPDAASRARIWARVFPPRTPLEGIDFERLAQLNITGGSIRNIALNAAFEAAAQGHAVTPAQIRTAARAEYAKLEKTLTEAETRGWA